MFTFRRQYADSQVDGGDRSASSTFAVFCAGGSTTLRDSSAFETDGARFELLGAIVEFLGIALAIGGAAFEIADASLFRAAFEFVDVAVEIAVVSSSSDQPERMARLIVPLTYVLADRLM